MDIFEDYLELRKQEILNDPFVAPATPHREHPYHEAFRLEIIHWMYDVAKHTCVHNIVLHHAIQLLDAVAPLVSVEASHNPYAAMQLVAICCVNVMQKIHADFSDLFQQVQKSVEGEFTLESCEYMEMVIQKIARPGLRRPTVMGFLQLYWKTVTLSRRTGWFMTYLSDLVLVHGTHLRRVRFSVTAVAVYVIAVGTVNQHYDTDMDPWPIELAKLTRIDFDGATGDLLAETTYDIHQLHKDFAVPEQGLLPSQFFMKYRSVNCMGVASYPAMSRTFLGDMLDSLSTTAKERRAVVKGHLNESDNLQMRSEPQGLHPVPFDGEGMRGQYFSKPSNSPPAVAKKQKLFEKLQSNDS